MGFKNYAVTAIVLLAVAVPVAGPYVLTAQAANANTDLSNLAQVQRLATADSGQYAASLETLTSGELGMTFKPSLASTAAYTSTGGHYIYATKLPSGDVLIGSDTSEGAPVICKSYSVECVTQVTTDADLIAAVPVWVTF
jgi:type II secretory pathway pseudopilin PulG